MSLTQYRDIFGKPNQGAHSYRIGPFATVDLLGTLLIGGILGYYLVSPDVSGIISGFIILMMIAIILHYMFGVDTALNVMLFGARNK